MVLETDSIILKRRGEVDELRFKYHMSMSDECENQNEMQKQYREMRGNYCGHKPDGLSHSYSNSDTVSLLFPGKPLLHFNLCY